MKSPTSSLSLVFPYLLVLLSGFISLKSYAQAISCHNSVNLSLNESCNYLVLPSDVLTVSNGGDYTLVLTTANGHLISDNTLRDIHLWTSITAKVTQNENSCWGTIRVEDKLGPQINCENIELNCFDLEDYLPEVIDICSGGASVAISSNRTEELDCDPDFVKLLFREYEATDGFGNVSSCSQTIALKQLDTDQIEWPDSFESIKNTNLVCSQLANSNGIPDVELTGAPFILDSNGEPLSLYPYSSQQCNISIDYRDIVTNNFGCKRVIMRTWMVNSWSCGQATPVNYVQKIEIADSEAPVIDCGEPFVTIPVAAGQACSGSFDIKLPTVSDDCSAFFNTSTELEIDIQFPGGFLNNATSGTTVQLSGNSTITYVVYDDCGNSSTCTQEVTVNDDTQPIAICDQNSVVSLRADGTAVARPQTFDDGSFDNCDMTMSVIKRSDTNCPCESASLDGFKFLGEQAGRYYYLAESGYSFSTAANLSRSLEGRMAILDDTDMVQFLENALGGSTDSIYIGLSLSAQGNFVWSDHSLLSTPTNWASEQVDVDGTPLVEGNSVILNANRQWAIISGNQQRPFILEVSDPCGFSSRVEFCCADAGSSTPLTVELRVIDGDGNFGACVANVVVQDKVEPVVNCPDDMTFDCSQNIDFNSKTTFGDCTSTDNCAVPTVTGPSIDFSNYNAQCSSGTVVRTFVISDTGTDVICRQTLTAVNSQAFEPSSIVWPDDLTVTGCVGDDFSPEALEALGMFGRVSPSFTQATCNSVGVSVTKDWPLTSQVILVTGTCSQIIRTWTVIDWCGDFVDGAPPTYEWQQVISITESEAPEILGSTCDMETYPSTNCVNGTGMASFNIDIASRDNCSSPTASVTERLFFSGAPVLVASNIQNGTSFSSATARPEGYPVGDHRFTITVRDDCGNTASCDKTIRVIDGTSPVVKTNDLSIPVQIWNNVPMVVLSAETLANVEYGCSVYVPRFSFSASESITQRTILCDELTTNPVPVTVYVEDDFGLDRTVTANITVTQLELCGNTTSNTNSLVISECGTPATDVLYFECATENLTVPFSVTDVFGECDPSDFTLRIEADFGANGQNIVTFFGNGNLDIEVSEQGTTNFLITAEGCNGLVETCNRQIETECVDALVSNSISGTIITESFQKVENVELDLLGSNLTPEFTDIEGSYAFADMPSGGSYKVIAQKDVDPLKGVSTLDLIQIQRHVLGVDQLTSPYKLIAADIDRSGSINGIDLIELRKLILGVYSEFPQNNSWRIVDASQEFAANPFLAEIKEEYLIPELQADMEIDFIGVKIGDVDQSYSDFSNIAIDSRSAGLNLVVEDSRLEAGVEKTVLVSTQDFEDVYGLQFDLDFDLDKVIVLDISAHPSSLSDNNFFATNDRASLVWHSTESVFSSETLIEVVLLPNQDLNLSQVMTLGNDRIFAQAYTDSETIDLKLDWIKPNNEEGNEMVLFPNRPNPWSDQTEITYYLPEAGPTVLSIFDISGRLIYKEEKIGSKGINSVLLSKENLNAKGVLYYELVTGTAQQTHKMILMD